MSNLARTILQALFRQRLAFWTVVLASLAAAGAASLLLEPVWRSQTIIIVPQNLGEPGGIGLLASRDLHRQVVERLGAATLYPSLSADDAVAAFGHDLNAYRGAGDTVYVTYDGHDPQLAAHALDTVLTSFGEQRARLLAQSNSGSLDQQAAMAKAALEDARQRLDAYRHSKNVWALDDDRRLLMTQRSEIDSDLKRSINLQDELAAKTRTLKTQITAIPSTVEPTDQGANYKVVDDAKARLLELQLKEQELRAKYTDTSQMVVTVREEIRKVQAFVDEMSKAMSQRNKPSANETYVALTKDVMRAETETTSAQTRQVALQKQLDEIDGKLAGINAGEGPLHDLEQAVANNEATLRSIDDARVVQAVDHGPGSGLAVIEKPAAPSRPRHPNPPLYFALALAGGVLGGLILALLAEALSPRYATPLDVERRLGLPVLAVLPQRS
ncbi:MAG TPA: Wzz/FepE/Etk N-terminal domain-containing protein [Patescibacteria group bacterium]|nr:Wzz/FepE/Etk N-terminal domain-containing protein [Patescibacteria group bacterium]